ncbi:MAG: 4Fe-4S binding protein [Myxococcales bacterium]|nr:4Fe-4S binding protein [Myxococcales bacterium]
MSAWDGHGWDLPAWLLQLLPVGEPAARAYTANVMIGGGTGVSYASIPMVDPVAGAIAMSTGAGSEFSWLLVIAWSLPLLLALLLGRAFCGWMCPFGTLARGLESALERLPFRFPRYSIPKRRWHRFVLLGGALIAGALGLTTLLSVTLPHWLVQQSIYSIWLMGGGGAALGAVLGLLIAGVVFGPTTYCATLCPTGAALSLPGRRRVVRLQLVQATGCGKHCDLCDRACWLSLSPSTGAPGPDCDNCARCVEVCPQANLAVGVRRGPRRVAALAAFFVLLGGSSVKAETADPGKPRLLLDARRAVNEVEVFVAVSDITGIELDANDGVTLEGVEVSAYVVRGPRGEADERGRLPEREFYRGPLVVDLERGDGSVLERLRFDEPTDPRSTPRRSIYRARVPFTLLAGDRVTLREIPGWTSARASFTLPERNVGQNRWRAFSFFAAGFLIFGGALSLTLGAQRRHAPVEDGSVAASHHGETNP